MKTYLVNEIFYSLQGEGLHTGRPAIFIRLSGCNRCCTFCDTDHKTGSEMTADEIADAIDGYPTRFAVVTGGEPLLQLDRGLTERLKAAGWEIAVETNGSMPVPEGVDWVACSPKEKPWAIDRVDELKVVYRGQDVEAVLAEFPSVKHIFLQPCYDASAGTANTAETIGYIKAHPHWHLSLQTHRMVGIE